MGWISLKIFASRSFNGVPLLHLTHFYLLHQYVTLVDLLSLSLEVNLTFIEVLSGDSRSDRFDLLLMLN